jgi:hypothetical protein
VSRSTLDFVPTPAPEVESAELDDERLVWRGAILHRLDTMGGIVWECFDGRTTLGEISRMLAETFGAAEGEVQRDVVALYEELIEEGLLEGGHVRRREAPVPPRPGRPPSSPLDLHREIPHATGRFVALGYDFAIRTDDARLAAHFERVLGSFTSSGSPARWYSVVKGDASDLFDIYVEEEGLLGAADADLVARYLLWHVNYQVIATTLTHVLVHASGATIGQEAVVFPGVMDAGKTTLVGGLVLDGFGFLTDELVAFNLQTGLIDPYPRPLNIGRGSWEVLAALRPSDRDEDDPVPRLAWHVDPGTIRPDAVAPPAALRWVIEPRFRRGNPTRLEPLSRPEAVVLLQRHAFNREQVGGAGIRALVEAVRHTDCARLENGDLASAVAAVRQFVGKG